MSPKVEALEIIQPNGFPGLPPGWIANGESFTSSSRHTQLFGLFLQKEKWTNGQVLFVLHGLGEHGGRYFHLPHFLQASVDAVYCLDHRGHGRSAGRRGHVERFDDLVEDSLLSLERVVEKAGQRFKKSAVHCLGHSLGGHIALRMVLLNPKLPLNSLTVTAPFLGIKAKVPFVKKCAVLGLSTLWGTLQFSTNLNTNALSHDPAVKEAYEKDSLVHDKMSARFFTELLAAMEDTSQRESVMKVPLQMIVPLQDLLVDAEKSLQFYQRLTHLDKSLKTYPDFFHEPVNEKGKEKVLENISSWIESHGGRDEST